MTTAEQEAVLDDRLLEAPPLYRTPEVKPSFEAAVAWCKHLATTHYENFHVATFMLPKRLRPHFYSVYAFCRTSDDLGDEVPDTQTATRLLASWRQMLHESFLTPEMSRHPVYIALYPTVEGCGLPRQPFDDLITAFEYDQIYTHHESLETLEGYSRLSANPVGRLVLLMSGYRSEELMKLSDEICTGLQLANFYQDVVEDYERGRRYLPADAMARFGVTDGQIASREFDRNFREMMKFLADDARARLRRGEEIVSRVDRDLASTLQLFVNGGYAILDGIAHQGYDTLKSRPVVTGVTKLKLLAGALMGKASASFLPRRKATGE